MSGRAALTKTANAKETKLKLHSLTSLTVDQLITIKNALESWEDQVLVAVKHGDPGMHLELAVTQELIQQVEKELGVEDSTPQNERRDN